MLFHLGIIFAVLTSSLAYSNHSNIATVDVFDEEEDDYSDLEADLKLLEEEDTLL